MVTNDEIQRTVSPTLKKAKKMKKSLMTLAALAASGAAMAQSSVTLYGRIDTSVGRTSTETTGAHPVAKLTQNVVNSNALNYSFWGIKGFEDLGGGLSAKFVLESGFSADTGAGETGIFQREAHVGLVGGFGEVALGRQYTSFHSAHVGVDMLWNGNFQVDSDVFKLGVTSELIRASNSVRYNSPNFAGFSGSATLGFGEDNGTTTNVGSATDTASFSVKYADGPVMVTYAHQENTLAQANVAVAQVTNKYDLIGGTYDFGAAKISAEYMKVKNGTNNDREYQLGVTVPMGAFAVGIGYAKATTSVTGSADLDASGFGLVGTYDLSKRSTLYAGYKSTKIDKNAAAISTDKATSMQAGVRHTF